MASLKLSAEMLNTIAEVRAVLNAATGQGEVFAEIVDELREMFDERSDRWRESDRGSDAEEWLDALGTLAENLEDLDNQIGDLIDELDAVPVEPEWS